MSHSLEYGVHLSRRACRLLVAVLLILGAVSGASEKPQHAADPVLQRTGTVDTASSQDLNSIYSTFIQKMKLGPEKYLKAVKVATEEATPNVTDTANSTSDEKKVERYPVASISFHRVEIPFIIGLWIFSASLAKIGFHMAPRLNEIFPESCLLIFVGVVIGVILVNVTENDHISTLTPDTFFFYMLPPIILDAGYFMPNRLFFDHLGTILLFAVIGTIFNTVLIGASLFAIGKTDLFSCGDIRLLDMLLFGSLVSAVDPVAVLAVFEEIQVNEILYIVVFGESLLNDAVTVVLYNLFDSYNRMGYQNIIYTDILAGFANFFVVAIGGTVIGVFWGFATAFVTRFTNEVRVIEPIFIFVMAYLAYMNAEIFHMSGILAITFCGITMKNYVEANISHKSHTTIKYTMKMLSSSSETIIFMFLGVATVSSHHSWNTWFVVMTILFCSVYRVLGVIILTAIANKFRLNQLNTVEKFVMSYGGLRGAVAFALVLLIKTKDVALQPMFMTTTIAVIYFTVFIQGITIKPLVKVLNVKTAEKRKPTMNERIHERLMDHTMAAIEDILGQHGNYHIRDKFKRFDNRFIRPYILRNHQGAEPKILETYSKLAMRDAMEFMRRNASTIGNISNTESMSAIFRNYTSGNLNGSASFSQLDSSTWNIDMQELEYNPSKKDLTDAKIHHLLAEELVKPYRRHRRLSYSRHAVNDRDLSTQVNYRMHVNMRRLVADKKHHHKRHSKKLNKEGKQNHVSFPEFQQNGSAKQFSHDYLNDVLHEDDTEPKSSREEWDSPITFTAKSSLTDDNDISVFSDTVKRMSRGSIDGGDLMRVTTPTATETVLPWKRDEEESSGVVKQCEFPAWASNKEYLAYNSPSATFLDRKRTLSSSVDMSEPDEQPSTSGIENPRGSVIGLFRRESAGSDHLSSCESTPQRERRGSTVLLVEEEGDPLGALAKSRDGSVPPVIPQPPQTPRQGRQQRRGSMLEISGSLSRDTIPEETLLIGSRRPSWLPQRQTSQPSRPPLGRQQTLGSALMGNVSSPSISSPSDHSDVDEDVEFLMKAGF